MSWPTGRGRRMWVSMPIWAVPFAAAFWVAAWIIALVIWGIVQLLRGLWWLVALGATSLWRLAGSPFERSRPQRSQTRL